MADEPFCPSEKNSSASSTSVRCICRISVASRSIDDAMTASVAKEHRVAVARNDLRRGGLDGKPEFFRDMGFDARIDIRKGADGAGNRAGRDLFPRVHETLAGARKFGIGLRELQAEGHRLGMDAMRAADHRA